MKATDVYRQDTIVVLLFDGGQQLTIDTGGRFSASSIEEMLRESLHKLTDVTFTVRFT